MFKPHRTNLFTFEKKRSAKSFVTGFEPEALTTKARASTNEVTL